MAPNTEPGSIRKVLVATDRSETAERAVRFAGTLAAAHGAQLLLLQVIPMAAESNGDERALEVARSPLEEHARKIAGDHGQAVVVAGDDPAEAILEEASRAGADVIVVGNVGMAGRKEFLLGNIPNRVSHGARATVVIVNTRDDADVHAAPAGPHRRSSAPQLEGALLRRAWRIGRVVTRTGLRQVVRQSRAPAGNLSDVAVRLRAMLDELGPTFAKLGQILSTRPDLLPPEVLEELKTLQDRVTPLTEAQVVQVMEQELRVPWEDVFASIDPEPLAAGTIAQVHRATLENGDRVVVKVQRPNAEQEILQDLGLLEMFSERAGSREAFRGVFDLPAMTHHLSSSLRRELDFRSEAANLTRMREVLKPFPRLAVPGVYEDYSTSRLLVMEEIQGVPVEEAPPSPARDEAARQLLEGYYHQVLTEGFFHADPHPGNMRWWNDKLYFLDLGMVGDVSDETRGLIVLLLLAFAQRDAQFLAEIVLSLAAAEGQTEQVDAAAFQEDIAGLIARFRDLSLRDLQLGPMIQEVAQISVRHRVKVPAALLLSGKAFAQMQLVAAGMDPNLDPFAVAESYVLRNSLRGMLGSLSPRSIFYEGQKIRLRVSRLLAAVEGIAGVGGGTGAHIDVRGIGPLEEAVGKAGKRISVAFVVSGLAVASAVFAGLRSRDS